MTFLEGELFHDKARNLTAYERLPIDFICTESWWHLLNGSYSTNREGTWQFTKGYQSIFFARCRDVINWMGALPRFEKELSGLRKASNRFYLQGVVMAFIECEFFHDARRNLIVYGRLSVDFICTELWWHLLKVSSSMMREATWPFRKITSRFYLQEIVMTFIEWELFHVKRSNLTVYEGSPSILFARSRDDIYWMVALPPFENELDRLRKAMAILFTRSRDGIYWMELFHDARRNLIVYERFPIDFICTELW
jgi:hypothetical protein